MAPFADGFDPLERAGVLTTRPIVGDTTAVTMVLLHRRRSPAPDTVRHLVTAFRDVAAELVAANQGIGTLLWQSRLYMQVDTVFVVLLTLAILGFVVDRCFRWAIFRFAHRYSPVA